MTAPRVLVLTGYGINCEEETAHAFERAGAVAQIVHINDLIENPARLDAVQIFSFPGGFSYGDDTGSGKALAGKIRNRMGEEFNNFLQRDVLVLGICNGFQVMVSLGIVPGGRVAPATVALEHNAGGRYVCRWVDLAVNEQSPCVFTRGIKSLRVPVAHGEGRFVATPETLTALDASGQLVMRYVNADGSPAEGCYPANPNGALADVAAVCDTGGRFMGLMPHPERNILFTQRDNWTALREEYRRRESLFPKRARGWLCFVTLWPISVEGLWKDCVNLPQCWRLKATAPASSGFWAKS
jgi:phosphoribosylformylglycinamidine synthase